jgi:hypothetical protein
METHLLAFLIKSIKPPMAEMYRVEKIFFSISKFLQIVVSVFLLIALSSSEGFAYEYYWRNYSEVYSNQIKVCHNQKATVTVDLPAEFLEKYETVTLISTYESTTYTIIRSHKGNTFNSFQPGLRLNDRSFFGNYQISVKESDSIVTLPVKLKTKYLQPGENKLTFSFDWRSNKGKCKGACCGYKVYNLHFKEEPILLPFKVSIVSNPAGAKVNIDSKHSSTTPFNLKLAKGWHTISLEMEGYEKFEGKIYIVSDKEISYDLENLIKKK